MTELEQLCARRKLTITSWYGRARSEAPRWAAHNWRITLHYQGRQLTTDWFSGEYNYSDPTAADVINGLCTEGRLGEMDWDEYCDEFGFVASTDKETADRRRANYHSCVAMTGKLTQFLAGDRILFENAEH